MNAKVRREEGFTVVEVLVAALVFALGAIAVLQVLDASARNAFRAEQGQVGINIAQRELEKLRQYDYDDVALTTTPTDATVHASLQNRVAGTNFSLNPDGSNAAEMVVKGVAGQANGLVSPSSTFTLGDVSGTIYRFVVWQNEPGCSSLVCPGTHDYKRVVVVVQLDNQPISYARPYQEVQSDISDPDASLTSGGGSGGGALVTAQQFYLSDTRCSSSASEPTRTDITADHPTHDTLATCSGATGKPDALLFEQAPDPAPNDPAVPGFFDYSDDIEPGGSPSQADKGLQLLRQDVEGCNPSPTGTDAKKKIHRWVTRPLPASFVATGTATLELFTRTVNNVNIPGAICIYLYKRATVAGVDIRTAIPLISMSAVAGDPFGFACSTVGTPAVGKCQTTIWPRGSWGRVRYNLSFAPSTTLLLNERLEVGLSVERAGTPQDALEFMYDHPDHPSRLEVKTTTPIQG